MIYKRLCKSVKDFGTLLTEEQLSNYKYDINKDYYLSIYSYSEEQYEQFKKTGSIRGIKDVKTNQLVWDFDDEKNIENARKDAQTVINRLLEAGIKQTDIELFFSGNKGFNIILTVDRWLSPTECLNLAKKYAKDAKIDPTVYDAPQILRVPYTRHPKSNLFKTPLTLEQFNNYSVDEIKNFASDYSNLGGDFNSQVIDYLDESFYKVEQKEEKKQIQSDYKLNLTEKPSNWKNCKWSLLQGNFKAHERHHALTILAATSRGLGFDKQTTYYLCKSALKKQSQITGQEEFPKEELWDNIIESSIFGDNWNGGQYTCKKDPWLSEYCKNLGEHGCKDREDDEKQVISIGDMLGKFQNYVENFDKNIIKTGNKILDQHLILSTSTLSGILGQPGSGKTTFSLNILEHNSLQGNASMFFSLDMGLPLVTGTLIKKMKECDFLTATKIYREDPKIREEVAEFLKERYKNVGFDFSSGVTVSEMRDKIREYEQQNGKKIRLVIIDYLECIAGPHSDATANAGFIANQLKDLANQTETCVLLLLQTQKHSTSEISDPLLSMKNIKGASLIEQSCSTVLTLWREGYNPDTINDDKYLSHAIVKNRFGPLWRGDFSWNGITGEICELSEEQVYELGRFRQRKIDKKLKDMEFANGRQWD